uniref:Fatty acid synthase n=2 Tax=Panagrellus redivivus TaxID=6233 RepID=A0A7E4V8W7_PANRE
MESTSICALVEAYNRLHSDTSLAVRLCRASPASDYPDYASSDVIRIDGLRAGCFALPSAELVHIDLAHYENRTWVPLLGVLSGPNAFYSVSDRHEPPDITIKLILQKPNPLPAAELISVLITTFRQVVPHFGTILSIANIQLPFAIMGDVYCDVFVDNEATCIKQCNILAHSMQIGYLESIEFVKASNGDEFIEAVKRAMKCQSNLLNVDASLRRNGLDSLQIASLEYELRQKYGDGAIPLGMCLKAENVRELVGLVNGFQCVKTKSEVEANCVGDESPWLLSEAQKQLLALFEVDSEAGDNFIEEFEIGFNGYTVAELEIALKVLIKRNPILRLSVGKPISEYEAFNRVIINKIDEFNAVSLNPTKGLSFAFLIKQSGLNIPHLCVRIHHILLDGRSMAMLVEQLLSILKNKDKPFESVPSYRDYVAFESQFLENTDFTESLTYWTDKISSMEATTPSRASKTSGSIISIEIPQSSATSFHNFASESGTSVFAAFYGIFRSFMHKLHGPVSSPVLIPVDNRLSSKFQDTLGLFVNLVVSDFQLSSDATILQIIECAESELSSCLTHSIVPFHRVLAHLRQQLKTDDLPIPEVMLVHDRVSLPDKFTLNVPARKKYIQASQIWYLREFIGSGNLQFVMETRDGQLPEAVQKHQLERFVNFLTRIIQLGGQRRLSEVDLLTAEEDASFFRYRESLIAKLPDENVFDQIWRQLESADPTKPVIKGDFGVVTSQELIGLVTVFEKQLLEVFKHPLAQNNVLGLAVERSPALIALVLTCWRLTIAPLMIAEEWPPKRINGAIGNGNELGLVAVVTDRYEELKTELDCVVLDVYNLSNAQIYSLTRVTPTNEAAQIAYLTFTSGSTGTPRAVASTEMGLRNVAQNYKTTFELLADSVVYNVVNPAFDIFFADVVSALCHGGCLYLASSKIPKLHEIQTCTHAYIMPAYLNQLDLNESWVEALCSLKAVLYGGETISKNFVKAALDAGICLFQQFGVTEHSIYSNVLKPTSPDDNIVVGNSFFNYHGYLVDSDGRRLPPENIGATCGLFRSAGIGVSLGYVALNAENKAFGIETWPNRTDGWKYFDTGDRMCFIDDKNDGNPWARNLVFLGRNDSIVKIKGNRVDLMEVKRTVLSLDGVVDAVILYNKEESAIAAGLILESHIPSDEIGTDLNSLLPSYMIPLKLVKFDKFPLNSNGKVDNEAVLRFIKQEDNISKNLIPATLPILKTDTHVSMALSIFSKHLKAPNLTLDDNLLLHGADSLKLLMALNELEDAIGLKISLKTVFSTKTIRNCVQNATTVETVNRQEPINAEKVTSIVCQHLWFLAHFEFTDRVSDSYHLRLILKFASIGNTDLTAVIKTVLQKHTILRTLLVDSTESDNLVYKILPVEAALNQLMTESSAIIERKRGFDHSKDLPIAFRLTDTSLEVVCHHIAVDGWSLRILIDDIGTFMKNVPSNILPDLKYFEFAQLQQQSKFESELKFFKETLADVINFALPTDVKRSNAVSNTAGRLQTNFILENADATATNYHSSMFAVFLAVYADSFFRLHENFDILAVGVPFANRKLQFTQTVGYFVNSLPIVIRRQSSMNELISHVHDELLQTTENSDVPFELVIQKLNPHRDPHKHAVFQVMVIFEDVRDDKNLKKGFEFVEVPSESAKFEQTWRIKRVGDAEFILELEIIAELFEEETIDLLLRTFSDTVNMVFHQKSAESVSIDVRSEFQRLWARFLDVKTEEIQDDTNFFEIGGHSLTAVRLCQALSKTTGLSIAIKTLFEHQTFSDFCDALNAIDQEPLAKDVATRQELTQCHPVNPLQLPLLKKLKLNSSLTAAYTHKIELQVPPDFNDESVETALTSLCRRHTCLCLRFLEIDGKWFMQYQKPSRIKLTSQPVTNGIDIHADQMLRASRNPDNRNVITLEISHLVADGHSMNVLAHDLRKIASEKPFEAVSPSYLMFSDRFRAVYQTQLPRNAKFWKNFLKNSGSVLESDSPANQASPTLPKSVKPFETVIKNGASILSTVSASSKVSPFAILIHSLAFRLRERLTDFDSTFRIAFCKDLRSFDNSDDYFQSIGFFVGTFVVPMAKDDKLVDTAAKLAQIDEHTAFNVDDIAAVVAENGDNGSLFDVMLVHDNAPVMHGEVNGNFEVIESNEAAPKSPLTFFIQNAGKDLKVKVEFDETVWTKQFVEASVTAWMTELHCDYHQKRKPYQYDAPVGSEGVQYPSLPLLLQQAFNRNASKTAFLTDTDPISYEMLHQKVVSIAAFIRKAYFITTGTMVSPDVIIPVLANKSVETWLICLGIIFAGAAYLPIDVKLTPNNRIHSMFAQIEPLFVVSESLFDGLWKCVSINDILNSAQQNASPLTQINNSNDLAYAILTSGTTGPPKAVAITHIGVVNMISDAMNFLKIDSTSVVYQFTNFCFDNSVLEVFASLAAGATLFVPSEPFNSIDFVNSVTEFGVTHAMLFPGLVNTFTDAELAILGCLECWVTGAEKLSRQLFERFLEMRTTARIVQNYGPTETTAYVSRKELKDGDDPQNLGSPMPGARVKVTRPDGWETAVGSKGELHVASRGLMRGYIGKTVQPFVEFDDEPGINYYPTGDICIRLPSNEIKFVGRRDNQVKIRGFRVELDEIDTILTSQANILSAKAVIDPKTGQDIIAFYTEKLPSEPVDVRTLRNLLKSKLPYYAVPRKFIKVDCIPLTANSKVDVDALLEKSISESTVSTSKATKTSPIKQIWSEILQIPIEEVADSDDFFYFGGNSLSATKLLAQVAKETGVRIEATEFFKKPTIGELEKSVQNGQTKKVISSGRAEQLKQFPLSYQQEQMLYLNNLDPLGVYNLVFVQEFKASLDLERFKKAVSQLIKTNDILRTQIREIQFPSGADNILFVQEVLSWDTVKLMLKLNITDVTNWSEVKAELTEYKRRKFDLFNELPLRCKVLRDSKTGKVVMVLIVHHIASDGFSTGLVENQLKQFYEAGSIDDVKLGSYGEYAENQRAPDTSQHYIKLLNHYVTQFEPRLAPAAGFVNLFNVLGIPKPKELAQTCRIFQFEFPTNRKLPATAFTIIINVIKAVVYSQQKSEKTFVIGAPCANRSDPRFSKTIGNFLTTLIYPATNTSNSLKSLESELLSLSKYAQIPFNLVSKHLRKQFGTNVLDIQVFVNCRYNIEDENDISTWPEAVPTGESSLLADVFPVFVNYPIEIDLDEYPDQQTKVTIRVSESFYSSSKAVSVINRLIGKLKTEILVAFNPKSEPVTSGKPLITLIGQCLNVPVSEINESESFFDNGGDSFALWRLHRAVLAAYNKQIELSELIQAKSISQMITIIEQPKRPTSLPIQQSTVTELFTRVHLSTTDPLGVIIIFVYPLIGGPLSYSTLITKLKHLDQARKIQTIVGLTPPTDFECESLEKLAKMHLSELNRRYALSKFSKTVVIGASFGASLGFELAKQLSVQFAIEKPPPKAILKHTANKLRVATFKVTSRQVTPDPRRHSVTLGTLPSAKPARPSFMRTRPESKVKLISIDGTIKTVKTDIPTFDEHKKQIVKIGKRHGIDESTLASEVDTSWKLLNMAGSYVAKAVPNVDVLLLRVRRSIELEMLWRQVCGKCVDVGIIPASHENMLMEPHVDVIAQKAFIWI